MNIAIAGGTGFIGQALVRKWLNAGHQVTVISRSSTRTEQHLQARQFSWEQVLAEPEELGKLDVLVNLAGATLNQRWTEEAKKEIIQSRLHTVQLLARLLDSLPQKPGVVIQGSAIGIYGTSLDQTFDESSATTSRDFLARVTTGWEQAAEMLHKDGVRLVKLRTGVVLGNEGGAFPLMRLPYMLGAGGRIGSGEQWLSWIHIEDMVGLLDFIIHQPELYGPVNAVGPNPTTNNSFGKTLATVYHKPYLLPVPSLVLKTILGERATLVLDGQRVLPTKAIQAGFTFKYPDLEAAFQALKISKGPSK